MKTFLLLLLLPLLPQVARAEESPTPLGSAHLAQFGSGAGPREAEGILHLLDAAGTKGQSNAAAFARAQEGARASFRVKARLRVLEGGDGGALLFLATEKFGARGPAPFLASWVEPNLPGTFAVGVDVHNPPAQEMFSIWGNYEDRPQREISLHWDGREIVKRVAPTEFRGDFADLEIGVQHVVGGAEVTVLVAGAAVYDAYFLPGCMPYEMRLALGAGTRSDASTEFDVEDLAFSAGPPAAPRRQPLHVEVFNHVLTNNQQTAYSAEASLPPADWAFGRVLMTIDIHDAGPSWDEWDRNGEVSLIDASGVEHPLVPFITSYRTPCHWLVDVTHFRPYLTGPVQLKIEAGTTFYKNRGYMMSLSLDYYHGTPALEPYRIDPLWVGQAHYRTAENHYTDFFGERAVAIDAETKAARIYTTVTGHSQIGEFTPSRRSIAFEPDPPGGGQEPLFFENMLWKTDCYLNPNRPQAGTWQYARAGWAPGDVVHPWIIELTPHVEPGQAARLRYVPEAYVFPDPTQQPSAQQVGEASQVVRSYLVQYRTPKALVPAPLLMVSNVVAESNAARAGMKAGDYLVSYNGVRIDSIEDLRAAIPGAAGQASVPVVVFRGADRIELTLEPGRLGIGLAQG